MRCISAAVMALFLLVAFSSPGQAQAPDLFVKKCGACHGKDGSGNANMAKMLKVEIKPLGHADVKKLTDGELSKIINEGKGAMKPVKGLTPTEVEELIKFMHGLPST